MKHKRNQFLDLLESYINSYLPTSQGLTDSTIKSYKAAFRVFFEFMCAEKKLSPSQISFDMLTMGQITEFLDWIETSRGCSVSTRNHRLSVLAAFSEYAQNRNFDAASVFRRGISNVPRKKGKPPQRSFFTRDEVKVLLDMPDNRTKIGIRDKTLLSYMYASGSRAQEVCDLTVGDIRFYPDRASINILGKGRKIRHIGIPMPAASMLQGYIKQRRLLDKYSRHVFSSQTHEMMTVSCIEEIFKKYVIRAKDMYPSLFRQDVCTPHSMRHTTAVHMLEAGVPLIVLKNFLGHSSIQTTQIYANISQDTMNRELKAWNDKWFAQAEPTASPDENNQMPAFLR